jgi:CubicO group peptidase (beta-lactamase class C family)
MAIGYSGMTRERQRKPLEPFATRAITPAAGFTSTVNDLAKFASWNFRALNGEDGAVLDPNTLREMQRVHWVDPDWKTAWGLGFFVQNRKGTTVVGHKGTCPGYSTNLLLEPKRKIAVIVLTNASDGPARAVTNGMRKTIGGALKNLSSPLQKSEPHPDLTRYEGRYGGDIWGGETAIRAWGNQLALIQLPSREMKVWKARHLEGDTFVRLTDDGEERERWYFQSDESGRVTGLKIHGFLSPRVYVK